jgi:hypothetical protein
MLTVDDNGCVLCPDHQTQVRTGNGGVQNFLQRHCDTAQCATNKKKKHIQDSLEKAKENAKKWFQPHAHIVPQTVRAPALITPAPLPSSSTSLFTPPIPPCTLSGCHIGVALLCKFHAHIEALPHDIGDADEYHPLAQFTGDLLIHPHCR